MPHRLCLSREAYFQLLQNEFFGIEYDDEFENIKGWIVQGKEYFDVEIIGANYFLSKNLEVYIKGEKDCGKILELVNSFEEKMLFVRQEFDFKFIDALMLNHSPSEENTLEQDMINLIEIF